MLISFQTIVSQDVSLFSGTIRSNLDPFLEHSDKECWEVLERCHLASVFNRTDGNGNGSTISLDTPISQSGSLSAGERQLVALARAILRRSNVVIMDEATSQIDTVLDDRVSQLALTPVVAPYSDNQLFIDTTNHTRGVCWVHCYHNRP